MSEKRSPERTVPLDLISRIGRIVLSSVTGLADLLSPIKKH
jgi:hypothetical protein